MRATSLPKPNPATTRILPSSHPNSILHHHRQYDPKLLSSDIVLQRQYLDHLSQHILHYKTLEDWYSFFHHRTQTPKHRNQQNYINDNNNNPISENTGTNSNNSPALGSEEFHLFLKETRSSLQSTLETVYPEIEWHPWVDQQLPDGYWKEITNINHFFHWLERRLKIRSSPSDSNSNSDINTKSINEDDSIIERWYNVQHNDLYMNGGSTLLNTFFRGSLIRYLSLFL